MAIAKLRVGDQVKIIAGRSKNAVGPIMKIDGDYVYVKNVNLVKKTVRVDRSQAESSASGQFKQVEAPIHRSNVSLFDAASGKLVKAAIRVVDGQRSRVNRKTGEVIASGAK